MALVEGFRGDVLVWLRLDAERRGRALPPARSVLVPVAAARSRDRGQHRRRLPALQQIVQLLLFRARSLEARHAQAPVPKALSGAPLTEPPPAPDEAALAELAARGRPGRPRGGSAAASRSAQVDAGSCNGCELEIHALNNAFYDLERFGLRFVASPRHADVLLVTGPVTRNMREALERTYHATPDPKWVVAVGDCAFDGGCFAGSYAVAGGVVGGPAGRSAHPRLPAAPDADPRGSAGAARRPARGVVAADQLTGAGRSGARRHRGAIEVPDSTSAAVPAGLVSGAGALLRRRGEGRMAKGQKRSNREAKKPKADKKKAPATAGAGVAAAVKAKAAAPPAGGKK